MIRRSSCNIPSVVSTPRPRLLIYLQALGIVKGSKRGISSFSRSSDRGHVGVEPNRQLSRRPHGSGQVRSHASPGHFASFHCTFMFYSAEPNLEFPDYKPLISFASFLNYLRLLSITYQLRWGCGKYNSQILKMLSASHHAYIIRGSLPSPQDILSRCPVADGREALQKGPVGHGWFDLCRHGHGKFLPAALSTQRKILAVLPGPPAPLRPPGDPSPL
jgi:hypothetical protein